MDRTTYIAYMQDLLHSFQTRQFALSMTKLSGCMNGNFFKEAQEKISFSLKEIAEIIHYLETHFYDITPEDIQLLDDLKRLDDDFKLALELLDCNPKA